jgi:hypothetical protein
MFKTVGNFLMKMMIHKDKNLNEVQPW